MARGCNLGANTRSYLQKVTSRRLLRRVSLKNRRLKFLSWLVRGKGIQMLVDYSTLKNSENFHSKRNISPNTGDRDLVTLVLVHPVYHSPPLSPTVFCMRNKSAFQMHPPRTDNLIRGGKVFAFSAGKIFSLVPSYFPLLRSLPG